MFGETLTCTVVVVSYLKDFVCPFSRNTFNTFAICGTHRSPNENADGYKVEIEKKRERETKNENKNDADETKKRKNCECHSMRVH